MHWHWRIRILLFGFKSPCCCPSFFLLEEWLAHFFIHHWIGSCGITHDGSFSSWFSWTARPSSSIASSAFRSSWISRKEEEAPVERIRVFHLNLPSSPLLLLWPRSRSSGRACPWFYSFSSTNPCPRSRVLERLLPFHAIGLQSLVQSLCL